MRLVDTLLLAVGSFFLRLAGVGLSADRTLTLDVADGDRTLTVPADATVSGVNTGDLPQRHNLLANGGAWFWQRNGTGGATAADDAYVADRWYLLTQTATATVAQSTGSSGPYAQKLTQPNAGAQRLGVAQIVEADESKAMRGRTLRLQFEAKCSTTTTLRYAIIEWQGAADGVTSDVVNNWASTTYTAGNFFVASTAAVTATTSVGTSYTACSLSAAVSASCNNLLVMVWTDAAAAQNVTAELAEVQLSDSNLPRDWLPDPLPVELSRCQRYCLSLASQGIGVAQNASQLYGRGVILFPTTMRSTPLLLPGATYTANAGSNGTVQLSGVTPTGTGFNNSASNWTTNALITVSAVLESEL